MSLNLERLENVVTLDGGLCQARCPACAENGQDQTGNHLRIYPGGKFGCCVHARDREHRRRIFALAGDRAPRSIQVRPGMTKAGGPLVKGIFGRLGRVFSVPNAPTPSAGTTDGPDGANEVQTESSGNPARQPMESRTARTGLSYSRAYAEKETNTHVDTLKEFGEGVRGVRTDNMPETEEIMPYLRADGSVCIPFASPKRFHWWRRGGQDLDVTRAEVLKWSEEEKTKGKL